MPRSPRLLPLSLSALVVLASLVRLMLVHDALPEVVASHFDGAGRPNGFQSKQAFALTSLGLQLGLLVLFGALPWLMRKLPAKHFNMPNREYWLAPARIDGTLQRVASMLDWFSFCTLAFMAAVFELAVRANLRKAPLENGAVWLLLAVFLGFTLVWSISFMRMFRLP
jgi:serine/threonine-protein kinase